MHDVDFWMKGRRSFRPSLIFQSSPTKLEPETIRPPLRSFVFENGHGIFREKPFFNFQSLDSVLAEMEKKLASTSENHSSFQKIRMPRDCARPTRSIEGANSGMRASGVESERVPCLT